MKIGLCGRVSGVDESSMQEILLLLVAVFQLNRSKVPIASPNRRSQLKMDGSALIRTESVNEPRCEIALEQSEGCLLATTETTWHVMLVLLQLRELLRKDPEKYDYSVY